MQKSNDVQSPSAPTPTPLSILPIQCDLGHRWGASVSDSQGRVELKFLAVARMFVFM